MNKRLLFSFAAVLICFSTAISYANYSNGSGKPSGITTITSPLGLGTTHNAARFNQYKDNRSLAALRGKGFYETDMPSPNNCAVAHPDSANIPAQFPLTVHSYPAGIDNNTPVYPFFDLTCMKNHLGTSGTNGGNASHLDERDFLSVRVCPNGNCGSEPVLTGTVSPTDNTLCTPGNTYGTMIAWTEEYNYFWPGVQSICNKNFTSIPQYEHEVNNLNIGDRVRFFAYVHNSAQEFNAGSMQHQQTALYNTNVELDWTNSQSLIATITGQNNNGTTVNADDAITLQYAQNGLTLSPVLGSVIRRNSGASGSFNYINGQTNLDVPMGVIASSYGNAQLVYVDFDVVQHQLPNFGIVKTATQNGQTLIDGDIADPNTPINYAITVTNNGAGSGNGPILTDSLPNDLVYAGNPIGAVTHSNSTVTLDFSGINFNAGSTQTFSFDTTFGTASAAGVPFCNEVLLQGSVQDTLCLEFGIAAFEIVKSVDITSKPALATPGQTLTYSFTITNTGTLPGTGTSFTDVLDQNLDGTTFATNASEITYTPVTHTVTGDFATTVLAPGQSDTVSFSIDVQNAVANGTIICNPTDPFDPITSGIINQVCVTVDMPFIITKEAFNVTTNQPLVDGDTVSATDIIRYDIIATNTSSVGQIGPIVIDDLAPELVFRPPSSFAVSYLSATQQVALDFGTVSISPNSAYTISFEVQLDPTNSNVVDGFTFCNPLDLAASSITNQICLTVATPPAFNVIKSAIDSLGNPLVTGDIIQPGAVLTFLFTVESLGANSPTGPIFIDQLDTNFDWTSFSSIHSFITVNSITGIANFKLSSLEFQPNTPQIFSFDIAVSATAAVDAILCNPADPFDPNTSIISNQLCFTVGNPYGLNIQKEARYPFGHINAGQIISTPSMLSPGDEFVYHISVTNTNTTTIPSVTVMDDLPDDVFHIQNIFGNIIPIPPIPPTLPSLGPTVFATFGPLGAAGSANDSAVAELLVRIVQSPSTTQVCNQASITQINSQPISPVIITGPDDACVFIDQSGGGDPAVNLVKSIEDINGQPIVPQAGDFFYYRVTATNTGTLSSDPFVASDILTPNITWAPDILGAEVGITYDVASTRVLMQFEPLAANGGTASHRFRVQLSETATRGQYCNIVTTAARGIAPSKICFNNSITGGSGGGSGSNPTVGVCFQHPTGTWGCEKRYPSWNLDDQDYVDYAACARSTTPKDECLNTWVNAKGFHTCTPAGRIPANPLLNDVPVEQRIKHECADVVIITKPCEAPDVDMDITVEKQIMHKDIFTESSDNYKSFKVAQSTQIYGSALTENAYKNICKEKIYYRITTNVTATGDWIAMLKTANKSVTSAVLRVHDHAVFSGEGSIFDRSLATESLDEDWLWNTEKFAFEKLIEGTELQNLLSGEKQPYTINYTVQSDLTMGLVEDQSVVKNIAFAVLDFAGTQTILSDNNFPIAEINFNGSSFDNALDLFGNPTAGSMAGQCDVSLDDIGSLGETAVTQVRIFRPFAQTRGGGDYAGTTLTQNPDDFEPTKYTSGEQFATKLTEINTFMADAKTNFYTFLKDTATVKNARFGAFNATPKNDGIYYLDLAEADKPHYIMPQNFVMNRSETFVIENGDLFISEDFVPKGVGGGQNISSDYFPAFIVRKGNIIIAPNVKQLHGLFMVEDGQFISGNINVDGSTNQVNSYNQLNISGNIMGDATDLLHRRRYIGEFNTDGVFVTTDNNPEKQTIQPSVRVTYDTRILEQTPPGLQNFLGGSWQQAIQ